MASRRKAVKWQPHGDDVLSGEGTRCHPDGSGHEQLMMTEFKRRDEGQLEPSAGRQTRPEGLQHMLVPTLDEDLRLMPAQRTGADWPTPYELCSYAQEVEDLRWQNRELQEHVEELDAFAHTVAHDLKGSLNSISGFASVLKDGYARLSAEQREECFDYLVLSAHKLNNVIDELLLLAQIRKADVALEPLYMAGTVAEARSRLASLIDDHQAEIVLPAEWPVAEGHGAWVEEVWVNYLSNAIKYGGLPPRVELGAERQADGMVRFWVRDNGRGLTPQEQAGLFTPFTRLGNMRADGHGLGLSVVQRIVDKLGGQVGIESIPGQGSVFSFTLRGCQP